MSSCKHLLEGDLDRALISAAKDGHKECLMALIERGANVNARSEFTIVVAGHSNININCSTALMNASLLALKEAGIDVNGLDRDCNTALIKAAENGHSQCVSALLEAGADVNSGNKYEVTPLITATRENHVECVQLLVKSGANANITDKYGNTALINASCRGHCECMQLLLKAGADVNTSDYDGRTAMMFATFNYYVECLELLIQAGADVNICDKNGRTALIHAARNSYIEPLRTLLQAGADVNIADHEGYTALARAVTRYVYSMESIRLLLMNGTRLDRPYIYGYEIDAKLFDVFIAAGEKVCCGTAMSVFPSLPEWKQDAFLKKMENVIKREEQLRTKEEKCLKIKCRDMIRHHLLTLSPLNLFCRVTQLGLPLQMAKDLVYNVSLGV